MDYFGELLGKAGWPALYAANLLLTIVGLAWTATAGRPTDSRRDREWHAWLGFWGGTLVFYLLKTIHHEMEPWWAPVVGLYSAIAALTLGYESSHACSDREHRDQIVGVLVAIVGIHTADWYLVRNHYLASFQQLATAIVLIAWAWRYKRRDVAESVAIATYGLLQLPLYQALMLSSAKPELLGTFDDFVAKTFVLYAIGKLALIVSVCSVLRK